MLDQIPANLINDTKIVPLIYIVKTFEANNIPAEITSEIVQKINLALKLSNLPTINPNIFSIADLSLGLTNILSNSSKSRIDSILAIPKLATEADQEKALPPTIISSLGNELEQQKAQIQKIISGLPPSNIIKVEFDKLATKISSDELISRFANSIPAPKFRYLITWITWLDLCYNHRLEKSYELLMTILIQQLNNK